MRQAGQIPGLGLGPGGASALSDPALISRLRHEGSHLQAEQLLRLQHNEAERHNLMRLNALSASTAGLPPNFTQQHLFGADPRLYRHLPK